MNNIDRKKFITLICWIFGLVTIFSNFICVIIPTLFSFNVPNTQDYITWGCFLDEHFVFQIFINIISFALPSLFCFVYLAGTTKNEKSIVRIVNAPIILSLNGTLGWIIQFIVQIGLTSYLAIVEKSPCWGVLPTSMIFTFLDCILAFTCSFFIMEILNRTFVLKRIFPEGKISTLEGLRKPSIALSFIAYFLGCVIFPVSLLLFALTNSWQDGNGTYDISIILAVSAIVFISLILTILLMRFFKNPLEDLAGAAGRISKGNYMEPVSVASADELGRLADTFNEMQKSLAEKDFMRDTFGKVVTPEIRDWLLNNQVTLGGQTKEITVMFCDIRSFTSLSEKLTSEQVVQLLNIYFTRMEKCISAHKGVINKYIGDCVMAIFGAPVDDPQHALNAFLAGLAMRQELEEVNKTLAAAGLPPVKNGIGLNTGFVTVGNIGAESRMEYTVIGDAVNVASRIEGLCKEYKKDFLMSEATAQAVMEARQANANATTAAAATETATGDGANDTEGSGSDGSFAGSDDGDAKLPLPAFLCESPIRGKEEKIRIWAAS